MTIVVDPAARAELREAVQFYDECREGLGQELLASVEVAFDAIARYPELWRLLKGRFRRCLIHRLPYGVIYAIEGNTIYYSERELPVISPSPFPSPDQGRGDLYFLSSLRRGLR